MRTICTVIAVVILVTPLTLKEAQPIEAMTLEERASEAGMEVSDFELISSVTEAESNRSQTDIEGRVMIAICILNRVNSDRWPDTIEGVLTQRGQFSTVRNGQSVVNRTDLSDAAVIEAVRRIEAGEAPAVEFFNCRGFFSGVTPYELVGGNYFSYGY